MSEHAHMPPSGAATRPHTAAVLERDERPWGSYEVLVDAPTHKVKRIFVQPGQRLSLQRHRHRDEHWYVVHGEATVTIGETDHRLSRGESVNIPRTTLHRIHNTGPVELLFIEVQTGDYFGEDDIERIQDDYRRA
jgi:mannose-6-phosphate isomerase